VLRWDRDDRATAVRNQIFDPVALAVQQGHQRAGGWDRHGTRYRQPGAPLVRDARGGVTIK
jgi:hypothetical protein